MTDILNMTVQLDVHIAHLNYLSNCLTIVNNIAINCSALILTNRN